MRLLDASFLVLLCSIYFTTAYIPNALQSGSDLAGSSFPASIIYNQQTNSVLITGTTFGKFFSTNGDTSDEVPREKSRCFLASVSLPTETDSSIQWKDRKTVAADEDKVHEACSAAVFQSRGDKLIVAGYSNVGGGVLNDIFSGGQLTSVTQYGTLFDFGANEPSYELLGGRVAQDSRFTNPVALWSSPADVGFFVVAQESDIERVDSGDNDVDHTGDTVAVSTLDTISNERDPMRFFASGEKFSITRYKYKTDGLSAESGSIPEIFSRGWREVYATEDDADIHVAGVVEMGDILIVAGSTTGKSTTGSSTFLPKTVSTVESMDGFVMKVSKADGKLLPTTAEDAPSRRISSIDEKDDFIGGICTSATDSEHFYIVGATEGELDAAAGSNKPEGSAEAFLMKVKLETLEKVWTKTLGALGTEKTQVRGVSCVVSNDGKSVWFGGVVQNGALLPESSTTKSFGADDIFVAKVDAEDGQKAFVRQIGSSEDDGFAMRGGLALDGNGNCIVVGSTYGSMYRERTKEELNDQPWISDVFVTTISADNGSTALTVAHPEFSGGTAADSAGASASENNDDEELPSVPNETENGGQTLGDASREYSKGDESKAGLVILLVVLSCFAFAGAYFVQKRSHLKRDVSTDRSHVIEYLGAFDVENIDLKHSATGGWHCSYSNDLANGKNPRSECGSASVNSRSSCSLPGSDPLLISPLTSSSVLRDSLFMDDEDAAENGLDGRNRYSEAGSPHRQGYDGLMDAYNATLEDQQAQDSNVWGKEIL